MGCHCWLKTLEHKLINLVKLMQIFDYTGFLYLWGCTGLVSDRYIKAAVEMRLD